MVAPEPDSDLYHRILTYIQRRHDSTGTELGQVNPLIDIDIDRPIAVAVETKRLATGVEKANTQLAGFGRCMLRLQHDVTAFLADTESGSNNNSHAIVLPLLTVIGSAWEVDFMIREKGLAVCPLSPIVSCPSRSLWIEVQYTNDRIYIYRLYMAPFSSALHKH